MSGSLFDAYVSGVARVFYGAHYADDTDRARAVGRAARGLRPDVAQALARQNARLPESPARDRNLAALASGAAAVVTGQQVGLFLGPLFTVHKAASAIRVARALAEESGRPVVPVFWLQTEDHDLPEIATVRVPSRHHGSVALAVPAGAGERVSVAHRLLPAEVTACLAELRHELGDTPCGAPHLARLERNYRPGVSFGDAFAATLAGLFAAEGLVFVDARDAALARATLPLHRRVVAEAERLSRRLLDRVRELEAAGFETPVHVRPGAPLGFYHPQGPAGPRYRLVPRDGKLDEVGGAGRHDVASLLAALEREPLCVSSSALLRPLVQDTLLPTAAYVGGPAEVAYFAEVAALYDALDVPMPLIVPRARLRLVEPRAARLMQRFGLEPADAAASEETLVAKVRGAAAVDPARAPSRATFERAVLAPFERALDDALARDPELARTIARPVAKTRGTVARAVAKLAHKQEQALARRDEELLGAVRRFRGLLHPGGEPQERHFGLPYFAARYGEREVVERVLAAIVPFDATVRDVRL